MDWIFLLIIGVATFITLLWCSIQISKIDKQMEKRDNMEKDYKQKEKFIQPLSDMVGQAISLSVTEPNTKTEDFVKDWLAQHSEDFDVTFGSSCYYWQGLDEAAEEYENWALSYSQLDFPTSISYRQAFKAGAEWMAGQGETLKVTDDTTWGEVNDFIHRNCDGAKEIQIRKKEESK